MLCKNCQSQIAPDQKICPTCQTPITVVESISEPELAEASSTISSEETLALIQSQPTPSTTHEESTILMDQASTPETNRELDRSATLAMERAAAQSNETIMPTPIPVQAEKSANAYTYMQPALYSASPPPPPVAYQAPLQPRKSINWTLPLLVLLILSVSCLLVQNSDVLFYALITHPSEVKQTDQKFSRAAIQATHTAQQFATASVQVTQTAKQVKDIQTQLDTKQSILYKTLTVIPPVLSYPLSQTGGGWIEAQSQTGGCAFKDNAYHITESQQNTMSICTSTDIPSLKDFAVQFQMTINSGDSGGIIFHSDTNVGKFYRLSVFVDGLYYIENYVSPNGGQDAHFIQSGQATSFHTGKGQANQIAIFVKGSDFYLYINQKFVATTHDTNYASGYFALSATSSTDPADVSFSNLQIW